MIKNDFEKHRLESVSIGFLSLLSKKNVLQLTIAGIGSYRWSPAGGRSFCQIFDKMG